MFFTVERRNCLIDNYYIHGLFLHESPPEQVDNRQYKYYSQYYYNN